VVIGHLFGVGVVRQWSPVWCWYFYSGHWSPVWCWYSHFKWVAIYEGKNDNL